MTNHTYVERDRVVNETACKFYKRLLVGFIRCLQNENGEVVVPEEVFDDVPDNIGFHYESAIGEDDDGEDVDVRIFAIVDDWVRGKDDCGGTEGALSEAKFFATEQTSSEKPKRHLNIVQTPEPDPTA